MKVRHILVFSAGGLLLVAGSLASRPRAPQDGETASNQPPALQTRPRSPGLLDRATCATGECHENITRHDRLHGPVGVGACDACHTLLSAEQHTYKLARQGPALCSFCHEMTFDEELVVHEPLKTGDCTGCHNPHGGPDRKFLKLQSMSDLCLKCHEQVIGANEHVHGPVAAGNCTACHSPHAAQLPNLLSVDGRQLCLSCHASIESQLEALPHAHQPVREDCRTCHDPHASNHAGILTQAPFDLCSSCHKDIADVASQAVVAHSVVSDDRACLNCHTPHVSHEARLLRDNPVSVCLSCHNKDVRHRDGTMTGSVAELVKPGFSVHAPAQDGNCRGCHNPHGASFAQLLNRPYDRSFYQKFEKGSYALCFDCHDQQLVTADQTTSFTNFRNGDRNLHYVHVKAPAKGGRSCSVCHATHASASPKQLRSSVAFGQWKIPIQFTATDMGGSCAAGCHRARSYDRVNPVSYELGPAPMRPGTPAETAHEEAPRAPSARSKSG